MRIATAFAAAAIVVAFAAAPAAAATPILDDWQRALYAAKTGEAAGLAERRLAAAPTDDEARFALGAAQFLRAVENLGRALHRYGLRGGDYDGIWSLAGLPILRIPVPANPRPEELTYPAARGVLAAFADDLAVAEKTLAAVGTGAIDLPLDLLRSKLDLDGDGRGSDQESLFGIFARVADIGAPGAGVTVDFDQSDVVWLQGYCHLLMAISELMLAYDWPATFDVLFPAVFPLRSSPYARLYAGPGDPFSDITDLVALVHLNRWPLVEPDRMRSIGRHLQAMIQLSRENWRRLLLETDDKAEWIPAPRQHGIIPGVQIGDQQVRGWAMFLDEFEAVLNGRKLIPHWRFAEGVNLRKLFEQPPPTLDLVMLIQGAAVLPYLERGELAGGETWVRIQRLLGGDFFRYVVWFN